MKIIIPLAGYGTRIRPLTFSRPRALLHVSGNTILGHSLNLLADLLDNEVIFVLGYKGEMVEAWVRENFPDLKATFVWQTGTGQADALWQCQEYMTDEDLLVVSGDVIVQTRYTQLTETNADMVCLVDKTERMGTLGVVALDDANHVTQFTEDETVANAHTVAGIYWFKQGSTLRTALQDCMANGRTELLDACKDLLAGGTTIEAKFAHFGIQVSDRLSLFHANERLLGLGYGTDDIIDRSYAEDFTALPPVFAHDSAEIDQCVLGPYVSIGADAVVRNCMIRNSIIEDGAVVENCMLDGAVVGKNGRVTGQFKSLFISDESVVNLGSTGV